MRRWITRLFDRIRYRKIYQPTQWQREPEEVYVIQQISPVKLPPVIHCEKNYDWARYWHAHPELWKTARMALRADLRHFTDEDETTAKYQTPPSWVK